MVCRISGSFSSHIVFPVVMYECESWTIKKAEHERIDAFELWCWRSLLRVPWATRRSNQSILKDISPEYSLETPILWPPNTKNWLTGKDPDAGKDWRWGKKGTTENEMVGRHHWLNGHEFEETPGDSKGQGRLTCCSSWGCKELDMTVAEQHKSSIQTKCLHLDYLSVRILLVFIT